MKILVVDDQQNLANLVKEGLESEGFSVDCLYDGETALTRIEISHDDYDAVLLDVMMPKMSGIEVCQAVRAKKIGVPIIMLTAKDASEDVINGLNIGADDYIIKPFTLEVLVARIRAVLRRPKNVLPVRLSTQNIELDLTAKKLLKDDCEVKLTLKEFTLFEYLMRHQNQVMSREQIISNVWDLAFDSFSNVVDVHVTNIRKKINDHEGKILETIHGVGYRING